MYKRKWQRWNEIQRNIVTYNVRIQKLKIDIFYTSDVVMSAKFGRASTAAMLEYISPIYWNHKKYIEVFGKLNQEVKIDKNR